MGVLLCWPNRINSAVLTGGEWAATLPRDNLKLPAHWQVARSDGLQLGSTRFYADLMKPYALHAVALVNHNLSPAAKWRITLGTDIGGSDLFDSGWQSVWAMTFSDSALEWGDQAFWEGITASEYIGSPFAAVWPLRGYLSARYVGIQIDDSSNPDGYIQIGRVFVGGGLAPEQGAVRNSFSEGWDDSSTSETNDSGVQFFALRRRLRVIKFEYPVLKTGGEFENAYEMQRQLGISGECLVIPDSTSLSEAQRRSFLGRLRQLSPIEYPIVNRRSIAFEIKEIAA